LTGVKVMWSFFERRVQPLMERAHPLFRYAGAGDPTRMSLDVLMLREVRSRVWTVIRRTEINPELDQLEGGMAIVPVPRHTGYDPVTVSLVTFLCFAPSHLCF
ncbi:hypothetical protein BAE44_0023055, partial [Dichanthelium oligosanthes]